MSRKSKNVRKRERQKRRFQERRKLALQCKLPLQLPPNRTASTAQLFELIEKLAHVTRDVIAELESPKSED